MHYIAVPPPQGLYPAHEQSRNPRGGPRVSDGKHSQATRDGRPQAFSENQVDEQKKVVRGRVSENPGSTSTSKSKSSSNRGPPLQPQELETTTKPAPRSPTPTKLPLPSPGLLPTPPLSGRRGFAPSPISQPVFSPVTQHQPPRREPPSGREDSVQFQGLQKRFQGSGSVLGSSPGQLINQGQRLVNQGQTSSPAAPSYSAVQRAPRGFGRSSQQQSPLPGGAGPAYQPEFASTPPKSYGGEQKSRGPVAAPLLMSPVEISSASQHQRSTPGSRGLLMSPPKNDGLLFSPPNSRGLLTPPPSNPPSSRPLFGTPRDLFEEIEATFGFQVNHVDPPSQTLNLNTPSFKTQKLQISATRRPPLFSAPSPALLPTPGKTDFLTPAKPAREAAAAAWAMVSGTPGILPSPARPETNQKAPPVSVSPARAPYPEHWRVEEISQGVKRGELFKAVLRVNAFKRMEGYVTIEGVGTDVLIDGLIAQNRAIEGDTVYVKVYPASKWPFLRGAKTEESTSESNSLSGLSSVLENLNLGTTRGGMFGLEDSSEEGSQKGSLGTESVPSESEGRISASLSGTPQGLEAGEGNESNGSGEAEKRDDVQKELDELLRQLKGGSFKQGLGGGSVGSMETEAGSAVGSLEGGSSESKGVIDSEASDVGIREIAKDSESLSEGDLCSLRGSEDGASEERRQSPYDRAVERLAAELKTALNRRPTGFVVGIAEFSPRREALVGYLQVPLKPSKPCTPSRPSAETPVKGLFQANGNGSPPTVTAFTSPSITLMPADPRMPKMTVWVDGLPDGLKERVREGDPSVNTTLVAARLDCWKAQHYQPLATVRQSLGQAGEIETETAAIMFMHKIHGPDFPEEALECLPSTPWTIPADEIARRRDLRGERIFTIDPPTARDLDDAVSITRLANGNFEIGVHIADVSFFVKPGTGLDKEARRRSTSVYLIQRVLPMLPPLLCEQLCSLNPGVDRLAFSVIWELTPQGEIFNQWMGRSVITSCCKLAYGHAQSMLENTFDPKLPSPDGRPPPAMHGGHSWDDVIADVIVLDGVAKAMRAARFEGGALKLDNTKVVFKLDSDGKPDGCSVYESRDANHLIEEFMLLANRSVAGAISRAFPEASLLRRHPPPNERKLEEFAKMCEACGLEINLGSAAALHASLETIKRETAHDTAIADVVRLGATKPMNLAKYFCTGELLGAPEDWGHYALATPLYTHFTSPIRRYPDIVVHRTLAAALEAEGNLRGGDLGAKSFGGFGNGHSGDPQLFIGPILGDTREALLTWHQNLWDEEEGGQRKAEKKALEVAGKAHGVPENLELQGVATYCNERKLASKQAQEASDKVFLCVLLKRKGGMVSDARVVSLGPKWATVYILRFGLERRIYFEDLQGAQAEFFESTRTVVISEATESQRSARKTVRKKEAVEKYGDALGEEAAELGLEPAVLPTTLRMFSSVPVVCYAITGNNRPMDVGVRLYL